MRHQGGVPAVALGEAEGEFVELKAQVFGQQLEVVAGGVLGVVVDGEEAHPRWYVGRDPPLTEDGGVLGSVDVGEVGHGDAVEVGHEALEAALRCGGRGRIDLLRQPAHPDGVGALFARRVASDEKRDAVLVDEVAAGGTDFHRIRGVRAERSRHYQRAQ